MVAYKFCSPPRPSKRSVGSSGRREVSFKFYITVKAVIRKNLIEFAKEVIDPRTGYSFSSFEGEFVLKNFDKLYNQLLKFSLAVQQDSAYEVTNSLRSIKTSARAALKKEKVAQELNTPSVEKIPPALPLTPEQSEKISALEALIEKKMLQKIRIALPYLPWVQRQVDLVYKYRDNKVVIGDLQRAFLQEFSSHWNYLTQGDRTVVTQEFPTQKP